MNHLLLWGKTYQNGGYQPLLGHLLDVAAVASCFLKSTPLTDELSSAWIIYLIALHDLGKADPHFQNKSPEQVQRLNDAGIDLPQEVTQFRHEARSAESLKKILKTDFSWREVANSVVRAAIRAHHGNIHAISDNMSETYPALFQQWEEIRDNLALVVRETLCPEEQSISAFTHSSVIGAKLSGLLILADWIASNTEIYTPPASDMLASPEVYFETACITADKTLNKLGLLAEDISGKALPSFSALWPQCQPPRPFQQALDDLCQSLDCPTPGLAIIEAPMGEGKTEAAIYLARCWETMRGKQGCYIALPTSATSTQMHRRYAEFLIAHQISAQKPRLVHGMAWLIDEETVERPPDIESENDDSGLAADWFRPGRRALLAPYAVGTIDQALLASLNVRFGTLRLFELANKVLIIDEVHAYDTYMTTILHRLLTWCGALEVPVILLSATLSSKQREGLLNAYAGHEGSSIQQQAYPLLTFLTKEGTLLEHEVATAGMTHRSLMLHAHKGFLDSPELTAELAIKEVTNGGCCCVIANTVNDAQKIYDILKEKDESGIELQLFHARFTAGRREEIEKNVVGRFGKEAGINGNPPRPTRAILVATQIVEQSLDIDFDVMITQIAPIDLLLQRSGRLWRHNRPERPIIDGPCLHVLLPAEDSFEFGATSFVYQLEILLRTMKLLQGRREIHLPEEFRELIENVYVDQQSSIDGIPEPIFQKAVEQRQKKEHEDKDAANCHLIPLPDAPGFSLAEYTPKPVDEDEDDEGKPTDYLHARTRLGDRTISVLLLEEDSSLTRIIHQVVSPPRNKLKKLFLCSVDLPRWWFAGAQSPDGQPVFSDPTPKWLRGRKVLILANGQWQGRDKDGKPITIKDSLENGVTYKQ